MQTDIHTKYGHCEISTGLRLYRSDTGPNPTDQLFFSTNYRDALGLGTDLQIWKAKKNIKLLFLLRHIDIDGKGESSLPDLYYDIYPNEPNKLLDDLDVKQDRKRRDPFARHLFTNHNINGWFTTIEDGRTDFEICLFNKSRLTDYFDCTVVSRDKSDEYYHESLMEINFYPSESFYKKSRELILQEMQICDKGEDPFKLHSSRIKRLINEYVKEGQPLDKCTHNYYDIRLKLKI